MQSILLLVGSTPESEAARRAFSLATALLRAGHRVSLALLEDAVRGALPGRSLPAGELGGVALSDDLAMRGWGQAPLRPGFSACSYEDLVDLLVAEGTKVMGVF